MYPKANCGGAKLNFSFETFNTPENLCHVTFPSKFLYSHLFNLPSSNVNVTIQLKGLKGTCANSPVNLCFLYDEFILYFPNTDSVSKIFLGRSYLVFILILILKSFSCFLPEFTTSEWNFSITTVIIPFATQESKA